MRDDRYGIAGSSVSPERWDKIFPKKGKVKKPELKPCPFCGLVAERLECLGDHWIRCDHCGCSTGFQNTEAESLEIWNRRASE